MKRVKLRTKIISLLAVFTCITVVANVMWNSMNLRQQAEREMLEKTQILAAQMESSWEFIELNQDRIDTDADGSYNFKGIYCAIAGKSISRLFMQKSDYSIRYISETPRSANAYADEFETRAFDAFRSESVNEHYGITEYDGREVFRYVLPLFVEESCVECHGAPKGEIDITGFPKEGLEVGDIGGAISIIMPIDLYLHNIESNVFNQAFYFTLITLISMIIVMIAISRLVTKPISVLESAAKQIGNGDLKVEVSAINNNDEIGSLAQQFNYMAQQLNAAYNTLEEQVENRTIQLHKANAILEDQRIQLEAANKLLQQENDYKSEFLTIMSHELRTPLTSILAFTEVWQANTHQSDDQEKMAVREIHENGQLLLHMINNLLEAARIDAGKLELHLEPVDLVDIIGLVKRTVGSLAERKEIEVNVAISPDVPIINADWEKVRRIIGNLVSNAIKYTKRGGKVSILADFDEKADQVVVKVKDNGLGIREEDIGIIFDKFVQIDHSSHRRYSGSGLGLAVVQQLVAAHGGEITVESTYKVGSIFTLRLPVGEMNEES